MLTDDLRGLAGHLRQAGEAGGHGNGLSPRNCDALAARLEVTESAPAWKVRVPRR